MILVTGSNGFIGSVLARQLNDLGHKDLIVSDMVNKLTRPELMAKMQYAKEIHADQLIEFLSNDQNVDLLKVIFHMGACSSTTETDEAYLDRVNTNFTKQLFTIAQKRKIPFIYASSAAVYGDGNKGFDDRGSSKDYQPLNLYGWSKLKFDVWLEDQMDQLTAPVYGLRFFNVYGPNEYFKEAMASLVFKAFHQINETGRLKLFRSHREDYKDGEQLRDFVYVKDICRWMIELYQNPQAPSGIYNMGYGQARSWLDLAKAVFKAVDKSLDIDWIDIPESIRQQYQYFTEANIEKLQSHGLSSPQWSLEDGVTDYLKNYLSKDDPIL